MPGVSISQRRLRAWLRLLRLTRKTENHLREFLRVNYATTLPRFDVAAALYRLGKPVKMSDLSKMLLVSNGNATNVVERLQQEKKVRRFPDANDKRIVLVELTEAGRIWFAEIARAHEEEVNRLFSPLSDEELDQLRFLIKSAESSDHDQDEPSHP